MITSNCFEVFAKESLEIRSREFRAIHIGSEESDGVEFVIELISIGS
jgi:hypothetical protein